MSHAPRYSNAQMLCPLLTWVGTQGTKGVPGLTRRLVPRWAGLQLAVRTAKASRKKWHSFRKALLSLGQVLGV